jgi:nicotinamide-nucleotide amidase
VSDDGASIRAGVLDGLQRTGFVITTGGLGPTRDDITKQVIADLFDAPLELDNAYLEELRQRFERSGRGPMSEKNRSQAEIPRGATKLVNRWGTAPGLWLEGESGTVVMLPGVPREMRGLLADEVLPRIRRRVADLAGKPAMVTRSRVLRTTGISESSLADALDGVEEAIAPLTLAFLPTLAGVDLRLTAWEMEAGAAESHLGQAVDLLLPRVGSRYYASDDGDLAAVLLEMLGGAGHRLAIAESCTGGLVGERLTAIPGSSAVFLGGVVAYDDRVKEDVLGVPRAILEEHGAVSEVVATAMADGVAKRFRAEAALAVTGIAGPGGGTEEKPVGTVCIAARVGDAGRVVRRVVPGDREGIRQRGAQAALDLLRGLV